MICKLLQMFFSYPQMPESWTRRNLCDLRPHPGNVYKKVASPLARILHTYKGLKSRQHPSPPQLGKWVKRSCQYLSLVI